jgi:uncharacterized protein YndB with AHSA1/START domain
MPDILHEIVIDAPPEKVYGAITKTEELRSWWTADSTAGPEVGSVAVFKFAGGKVVFRMRIDELVPGKRVVWTCLGEDEEWKGTRLTFDLHPAEEGGTDLRFTHAEWRSLDGYYAVCNTTWGELMYRLKEYLEGGSPGPLFSG